MAKVLRVRANAVTLPVNLLNKYLTAAEVSAIGNCDKILQHADGLDVYIPYWRLTQVADLPSGFASAIESAARQAVKQGRDPGAPLALFVSPNYQYVNGDGELLAADGFAVLEDSEGEFFITYFSYEQ